jgi:hypothetical protein
MARPRPVHDSEHQIRPVRRSFCANFTEGVKQCFSAHRSGSVLLDFAVRTLKESNSDATCFDK